MIPIQKLGIDWPNIASVMIPPSTAVQRRKDTKRNGKRDGQKHREQRQFDRCGQRAKHDPHGRLPIAQRVAEITLRHVHQICEVLDIERFVEAQGLADHLDFFFGRAFADEQKGGITPHL
jgi:hypothetical protein